MNIIFGIVVVTLVITIVLTLYVLYATGKRGISKSDRTYIQKQWYKLKVQESAAPKLALVEADTLLDFTLEKLRYTGTLGDKLKVAHPLFSDREGVWEAHKLRNRVVHEIEFVPSSNDFRRAMYQFERALKDLRAL